MTDSLPGWYGKIASIGDFAHRRLPPEWVARCDAWLSRALPEAKATLGPRWLDVYLTAPILRFAWTPGLVDRHCWTGVLMASCDNVGRYYPLIIAQRRSHLDTDRVAIERLAAWYDSVDRIALATLDERSDGLQRLEDAIARSAGPGIADQASDASRIASLFERWREQDDATRAGRSAWWIVDEDRGPDAIEHRHGLPDGAQLARLFSKRHRVIA